jgi:conjugal transfer pilus assembly protein TraU
MLRKWLVGLFLISSSLEASEGKFINPITDVCWECLFPITISGVNVTPDSKDYVDYNQVACVCPGLPPKIGVPLTFWEPTRLVDVTRNAYKLVGLGGISVGSSNIKNRGSIGITNGDDPSKSSFYHVHWYAYPILYFLEVLTDFVCMEKGDLDVAYMTELDPTWGDDHLSLILNAEASIFGNPIAQLACIADCTIATARKPRDELFWCAGCEGSLYPFTGSVAHHVGAVQASHLLVHRMIAKLHRSLFLKGFNNDEFCEAQYMPIIKKTMYKTQLTYPIAQTSGPCNPLGSSEVLWGAGKSFPIKGEEFVYLVWTKKQCCLDALVPATGGAL